QFQSTSLLSGGIDTNFIKSQKTLPLNIDVSSVNAGLQYEINSTNYLFNPRTGSYGNLTGSVGIKKVKQNNIITGIKDPAFNYVSLYDSIKSKGYQLRLKVAAAHYIPIGKYSTLKTALTGGLFISPEIFRNELFQIGGYSLLRGFDEESIYTNGFGVASAEYRVLVSRNSYFFLFTDGAVARAKYQSVNSTNNFISAGLGLLYETKAGLINISFALGKRNDVPFNLREAAKLHFGYINYF
ncbi:MAG: BamA/TamA family outer membrane protein, partial [Ferruginibacter sp.]